VMDRRGVRAEGEAELDAGTCVFGPYLALPAAGAAGAGAALVYWHALAAADAAAVLVRACCEQERRWGGL